MTGQKKIWALEAPLDCSAQDRLNSAVKFCLSSARPLKARVDDSMKTLTPILGEKFGRRTTILLERLKLSEKDGVRYIPSYGAHYGAVSPARLKRWLLDLYQLHAWTCFLMGQDPELKFWFDD